MGDAFADKLESSLADLKNSDIGEKVAVGSDHKFVGFDAYKQVIDSGVDVVVLATPPHFRPAHLQYAVEKGKHAFVEKPVAVDGPGVRSMFATCELAKQKNLAIVSGLCWRYHAGMRATFAQLTEGAVGEIVAIRGHVSHADAQEISAAARLDRYGIPAPQLERFHLALGRFQRRAARAQPR